jgi:hypothetical protein
VYDKIFFLNFTNQLCDCSAVKPLTSKRLPSFKIKFDLLFRSPEWNSISDRERQRLGLTFQDDGEFWSVL